MWSVEQGESSHQTIVVGSANKALAYSSMLAFVGLLPFGVFTQPVTEMPLSTTLKGVLVSSPLITAALSSFPMARAIETNGGINMALKMVIVDFLGVNSLLILSCFRDIKSIGFGSEYFILLGSGLCIGFGSGPFGLMNLVTKWAKRQQDIAYNQAVFGGVADLSFAITPIVTYGLRNYGYSSSLAIYSGLLALGGLISYWFLTPAPFNQFKKYHSHTVARNLAICFGQLEATIPIDEVAVKQSILTTLRNRFLVMRSQRGITLNLNYFISIGGFLAVSIIFPNLLNHGFNLSAENAIISSSTASAVTIITRTLSGSFIARWDQKTQGVKVYILASALGTLAALTPALFALPEWALYTSLYLLSISFGATCVPTTTLAQDWAQPKNSQLAPYNPTEMISSLAISACLGGILLPILLGLMADHEGIAGYRNFFFVLAGLLALSALLTYKTHQTVIAQDTQSNSENSAAFFQSCYKKIAGRQDVSQTTASQVTI